MEETILDTQEFGSAKVEVLYDPDPQHPREYDSNFGILFAENRSTNISDDGADEAFLEFEKNPKRYIYLPIYAFIHSGTTINTTGFSCRFDSGQLGWIFIKKTEARASMNWKRLTTVRTEQIENILRGEVSTMDQYLQGEIYGWRALDQEGEVRDSCWGYYSEVDAMNEGKDYVKGENILIRVHVNPERHGSRTKAQGHQYAGNHDTVCDRSSVWSL